jgi:very-short-patch-repair endonuclease
LGGVINGWGIMTFLMNDPKLRERRKALRNNPTEAEKIFWGHVRNRQFCGLRFFRQYSCGPYILDFYCPNIKLAVEIDGGQHNDEEIRNYDEARSDYLRAHGIEVIRFWNNHVVRDMDGVLSLLVEKVTPPHLPLAQGEETAEVKEVKQLKKDT